MSAREGRRESREERYVKKSEKQRIGREGLMTLAKDRIVMWIECLRHERKAKRGKQDLHPKKRQNIQEERNKKNHRCYTSITFYVCAVHSTSLCVSQPWLLTRAPSAHPGSVCKESLMALSASNRRSFSIMVAIVYMCICT